MKDDYKSHQHVDHSTDHDQPNMPFKPAANPFETQAETSVNPEPDAPMEPVTPVEQPIAPQPPQPTPEPEKKSGLLGFGKKKQKPEAPRPQTTEAIINGRHVILVGRTEEQEKNNKPPTDAPEDILFSWRAPEFAFTKKPAGWYAGLVVIALVLAGLAVWAQQWTAIVLVLIMGVGVGIWANRRPRELEYKLSNYGVYVENKKYYFDAFRGYYTIMDYNQKTLELVPGKKLGTLVSIPLVGMESEVVEQVIAQMIPKTEHSEDAIDKLFRTLRF